MKFTFSPAGIRKIRAEGMVFFTFEDGTSEEKELDTLLDGVLARMRKSREFLGKKLTSVLLRTAQPFGHLLLVGLGKKADVDLETVRRAAGTAAKGIRDAAQNIAVLLPTSALKSADTAQAVTEGLILGDYRFLRYKSQGLDDCRQLNVVQLHGHLGAEAGMARGQMLAAAVNLARDQVNTPPIDLNPSTLEQEARSLAKRRGLKLTVFHESELLKRKMGAIVAVGQGSVHKARMLILEYKHPKAKRHLVFCGKGVCYDSGGYNLKVRMQELMKDDMGGAAALLGMLDFLSATKAAAHVTVIIGAVENLISGSAYKPGDVVRAMNGKTIEIANTDAEGRVVLADCLSYASTLKYDSLIDVATLTGAAMVALGANAAAVCTPNDALAASLIKAGELSGDRCWRIPMWDDYKEDVKSDIADVKNLGFSMYAGITAGAVFLQEFVQRPEKWAHIDMGGTVNQERDRPYIPKGASGWGVRVLSKFVEMGNQ